jgi:hypothetical protein
MTEIEDPEILFPRSLHSGFDDPDKEDEEFRYMDWRRGTVFPVFHDPFWRPGAVVRWILERTPEAVNGWTIDERLLGETLSEIHQALRAGEIHAYGISGSDPTVREIPRVTWFAYEIWYELRNGLIHLHVVREGADFPDYSLTHLRLDRREVISRWPAPGQAAVIPSSAGAEYECVGWLRELMGSSPHGPRQKSNVKAEALQKFPKLSDRGFDRAWTRAITESGADDWSRPGRRRRKAEHG